MKYSKWTKRSHPLVPPCACFAITPVIPSDLSSTSIPYHPLGPQRTSICFSQIFANFVHFWMKTDGANPNVLLVPCVLFVNNFVHMLMGSGRYFTITR